MDKGILRLAEMIYAGTINDVGAPLGLKILAHDSIEAAEVFYQVKGEREMEVEK